MNICVFADIHGNLTSLKLFFETQDFKTADKIIFLGDVVGCGRPNECIEFLQKSKCDCLLGNNDSYVCKKLPKNHDFSKEKISQTKYMQDVVTPNNKKFVMSWLKELYFISGNKKLYFTHYPWESEEDVVDDPNFKTLEVRQKMLPVLLDETVESKTPTMNPVAHGIYAVNVSGGYGTEISFVNAKTGEIFKKGKYGYPRSFNEKTFMSFITTNPENLAILPDSFIVQYKQEIKNALQEAIDSKNPPPFTMEKPEQPKKPFLPNATQRSIYEEQLEEYNKNLREYNTAKEEYENKVAEYEEYCSKVKTYFMDRVQSNSVQSSQEDESVL